MSPSQGEGSGSDSHRPLSRRSTVICMVGPHPCPLRLQANSFASSVRSIARSNTFDSIRLVPYTALMSAEHSRLHEIRPASTESIQKLFSHLQLLSEKPPKNVDIDETAAMYGSKAGEQARIAEARTGLVSTIYSLKKDGEMPRQFIHIRMSPAVDQGYLTIHQFEEDIHGRNRPIAMRYYIHKDKVFSHKITDEDFSRGPEEQKRKEKEDQEQGFALMTESEVIKLNTHLAKLTHDE